MTFFKRANNPDPPTTPARALDAVFTPSPSKWVLCIYTIQLVEGTAQTSTVELRSDSASPPTTVRCSAILAATTVTGRQLLVYLCPPGDNVKLVSSGTGTPTIVHQTECALT